MRFFRAVGAAALARSAEAERSFTMPLGTDDCRLCFEEHALSQPPLVYSATCDYRAIFRSVAADRSTVLRSPIFSHIAPIVLPRAFLGTRSQKYYIPLCRWYDARRHYGDQLALPSYLCVSAVIIRQKCLTASERTDNYYLEYSRVLSVQYKWWNG